MVRSRHLLLLLAATLIVVAGALSVGGAAAPAEATGSTRVAAGQMHAAGHEMALPTPWAKATPAEHQNRAHPALQFWVAALAAALLGVRSHTAGSASTRSPSPVGERAGRRDRGPPIRLITS